PTEHRVDVRLGRPLEAPTAEQAGASGDPVPGLEAQAAPPHPSARLQLDPDLQAAEDDGPLEVDRDRRLRTGKGGFVHPTPFNPKRADLSRFGPFSLGTLSPAAPLATLN